MVVKKEDYRCSLNLQASINPQIGYRTNHVKKFHGRPFFRLIIIAKWLASLLLLFPLPSFMIMIIVIPHHTVFDGLQSRPPSSIF